MLVNDYFLKDNVFNFNDVNDVVSLAKKMPYYTRETKDLENTVMVREGQFPEGYTRGYRSDDIMKVYPDIGKHLLIDLFFKTIDFKIFYEISMFFDILTGDIDYDGDALWEQDNKSVLSGTVFLNNEPPQGSGIEIVTGQGIFEFENRFNRMVIHKSRFKQRPVKFFGSDLNNSRLCLTIKVQRLGFVI